MSHELQELRESTADLLNEINGRPLEPDSDGDWTIHLRGHRILIRPTVQPMPHVFIWTGIVQFADPTCLAELNDLNLATGWCRFIRTADGAVYVAAHLPAYSLTKRALIESIGAVGAGAALASPMIAAVYGGTAA